MEKQQWSFITINLINNGFDVYLNVSFNVIFIIEIVMKKENMKLYIHVFR